MPNSEIQTSKETINEFFFSPYQTDAIPRTNLLSSYEMQKITLPGSPMLLVGFNSRTIIGRPQSNLESVWATLIEDAFAAADLRPLTLVSALRDEKKDQLIALTKSAGLIKELVDKNLHPPLNNKTAAKMWTLLEDKF